MNKKGKNKHKKIEVPIYNKTVLFIAYTDYKYANKILSKFNLQTRIGPDWLGFCNNEDIDHPTSPNAVKKVFIIAVKNDKLSEATLVHECFHLTQDILEYVGIPFKKGGHNEPYTYLQSYLYEILKKLI